MAHEKHIDEKTLIPVGVAMKVMMAVVAAGMAVLPLAKWMGKIDERTEQIPQLVRDVQALRDALVKPAQSSASAEAPKPEDEPEPPAPEERGSAVAAAGFRSETDFRFQFSGCHGTPGQLIMKRGTYVLLDNRDDKAVTVAFAGRSWRIPAYGAVTVRTVTVGTHQITCDGGGAAIIIIEE